MVQDRALEAEADRLGHKAASLQMREAAGSRPSPRAAAPQPAPVQSKPYKLMMGSYFHSGSGATGLPSEAAGHSFVVVEHPTGRREAWGFSPADASGIKSVQGLQQMRAGVPSRVHRDDSALGKPGVRMQSYEVSPTQARAALAKISEYRARQPNFSFTNRDCGVFARDVVRAAGVSVPGNSVVPPRQLHARMSAAQPAAAQPRVPHSPTVRPASPHGAGGRAPAAPRHVAQTVSGRPFPGPPRLPGPPGR